MKYRLYIDEVGNSDLGASKDPNHRYLSLTGVILELEYVRATLFPAIEGLKTRYFASHPDDPLTLHRKELVNKRYPFGALRDPDVERRFNVDLLSLLRAGVRGYYDGNRQEEGVTREFWRQDRQDTRGKQV